VIGKAGEIQYSNVLVIRLRSGITALSILPNPGKDHVQLLFTSNKNAELSIRLVDPAGKVVLVEKQKVQTGANTLQLRNLDRFATGTYLVQVILDGEVLTARLVLSK
jgi:hypothetical protein